MQQLLGHLCVVNLIVISTYKANFFPSFASTHLDFLKLVPNIQDNLIVSPLMVDTNAVPDPDSIYEARFSREFWCKLVVEDTTDTYTTSCH